MFECLRCGKLFRTKRRAERAAATGCPGCGGNDIEPEPSEEDHSEPDPPRCQCNAILEPSELAAGQCDYCAAQLPEPPVPSPVPW